MAIPKSAVMEKASTAIPDSMTHIMIPEYKAPAVEADGDTIRIKPYQCLNEWIVVLQSVTKSSIELANNYKNEGIVIGVGQGILTSECRLPPQVTIGDRVMFRDRDIVYTIEPDAGFYCGKRVVMLSERNLMMILDPVPFEIVNQ